jgi:hypothetical protein
MVVVALCRLLLGRLLLGRLRWAGCCCRCGLPLLPLPPPYSPACCPVVHPRCCCRLLAGRLLMTTSCLSLRPPADNTLVDAVSCTIAPNDWDLLDWRYVLVRLGGHCVWRQLGVEDWPVVMAHENCCRTQAGLPLQPYSSRYHSPGRAPAWPRSKCR